MTDKQVDEKIIEKDLTTQIEGDGYDDNQMKDLQSDVNPKSRSESVAVPKAPAVEELEEVKAPADEELEVEKVVDVDALLQ